MPNANDVFWRDGLVDCEHSTVLLISKRIIDILVSLSFLGAFFWLFGLLWLGVVFTSNGPGLYAQRRCGKNGRDFNFYKFRSMIPDSSAVLEQHLELNAQARKQWTDFQKLEDDPRVTRFGAFIRKTSLDELPQFWNVLVGDMSLIGPRPCMTNQRDLYGKNWGYYCAVKPGITGLWQVSGRNKLSYEQRVALDIQYVRTMSSMNDIRIFFKTIWVVLSARGSR